MKIDYDVSNVDEKRELLKIAHSGDMANAMFEILANGWRIYKHLDGKQRNDMERMYYHIENIIKDHGINFYLIQDMI